MSLLCKKLKKANYGLKITLILMILMIVDNRGQSRFLPFFFVSNRGFDRTLEPEPDLL